MSSLAMPWLDLTVACQRHTLKRTTYLTARPPFDPSRFGGEPIDTADARTFVDPIITAARSRSRRPNAALPLQHLLLGPCPRPSFNRIIFPGHVGIVYQAKNACYTGRSRARSLCLTRSGAVLSDRALSKLRADDNDARHVYARLREYGAPALKVGESGARYLERALLEGPFRKNPAPRQSPLRALALVPRPAPQDRRGVSGPPLPQAHRPSSRRGKSSQGYDFRR